MMRCRLCPEAGFYAHSPRWSGDRGGLRDGLPVAVPRAVSRDAMALQVERDVARSSQHQVIEIIAVGARSKVAALPYGEIRALPLRGEPGKPAEGLGSNPAQRFTRDHNFGTRTPSYTQVKCTRRHKARGRETLCGSHIFVSKFQIAGPRYSRNIGRR